MDDAELVMRLRCNAQVCREEQRRDLPPGSKAELANDAREWDDAASRIESLATESGESKRKLAGLRTFANEILGVVFDGGDYGGCDLQELAVLNGLLEPVTRTEPCGEACNCAEAGDFPQTCYRKTDLVDERGANDKHE